MIILLTVPHRPAAEQGWDIHEFWAINTCIYVYLYGYAYIWTKYI